MLLFLLLIIFVAVLIAMSTDPPRADDDFGGGAGGGPLRDHADTVASAVMKDRRFVGEISTSDVRAWLKGRSRQGRSLATPDLAASIRSAVKKLAQGQLVEVTKGSRFLDMPEAEDDGGPIRGRPVIRFAKRKWSDVEQDPDAVSLATRLRLLLLLFVVVAGVVDVLLVVVVVLFAILLLIVACCWWCCCCHCCCCC